MQIRLINLKSNRKEENVRKNRKKEEKRYGLDT